MTTDARESARIPPRVGYFDDTIRYDILFALKNWQASCQFNLCLF